MHASLAFFFFSKQRFRRHVCPHYNQILEFKNKVSFGLSTLVFYAYLLENYCMLWTDIVSIMFNMYGM